MIDNNGFFYETYAVDYRSIKPDYRLSFTKLMEYIQETSIRHTNSTPFPMQWYSDNKKGFLLTNWHVIVKRYPCLYDNIRIMTAPMLFKGILAERYFEVKDESGGIIATACSRWSFVDLDKRRPVKLPQELADGYGKWTKSPPDKDYALPHPVTKGKIKIAEEQMKPHRRDIDTNMHVNNLAYLDWAENYIPDTVYADKVVTEMKTAYKHECLWGNHVLAETCTYGENGFITTFYNLDKQSVYAEVYTKREI